MVKGVTLQTLLNAITDLNKIKIYGRKTIWFGVTLQTLLNVITDLNKIKIDG